MQWQNDSHTDVTTHQIFKDLLKDSLGGVRKVAHWGVIRGGGAVHHVLRLMAEVATKL